MKKLSTRATGLLRGAILLTAILLVREAHANIVLPAVNNATVQPSGPRPGVNGKQFFNMEGSGNGSFASFGVADFQTSAANIPITGLTVDLTQANAAFTNNGTLIFYLSTDTTTNIDPVTSPLTYNSADIPTGIGNQLSTLFLLGAGTFTQISDGTVDSFSFLPSPAATAYLHSQVLAGGRIRLVIAPGDAGVAATYAGFSNTEFAGPQLILATPVPEPRMVGIVSLSLLICVVGLVKRRRLGGPGGPPHFSTCGR